MPLVEFVPPANMPHKRVIELLKMDPPEEGRKFGGNQWQNNGQEQVMNFSNEEDLQDDVFTQTMLMQLDR